MTARAARRAGCAIIRGMPLELWGAGEIVENCGGVSLVTFKRWRDDGGFPPPGWTINRGRTPVWDAEVVRAWYAGHRKRIDAPRGP